MSAPIIAENPPHDGKEYECQCARCGSSVSWETCEYCGGEGFDGHDCGEDCCSCRYPVDNVVCGACDGNGTFGYCLSSEEWCIANPLPDRENMERGKIEWFSISKTEQP